MRRSLGERGVSIVGTVLTMITLGIMGAALVGIVAAEQESRKICLSREYSFYAVQAGLEYALREINEGGYPIVEDKQFADSTFTVEIDPGPRRITATGQAADATRHHSITTDLLAADCVSIDASGATLGGSYDNELYGIVLNHSCLIAVNVDGMTLDWTPDTGGTVRKVRIGGVDVYDDISGTAAGVPIDTADYRFDTQASIDYITFTSDMGGKSIDLTITFTDSSSLTESGIIP